MKIIVLLVVVFILYLITRNYKTEQFKNINLKQKEKFEGDILNHEAGILVALMAKVAKADGSVSELEAQLLKHTLDDISRHFENKEEIRALLKQTYQKEKESFENTVELAKKLYSISKFDYQKRLKILEYLLNLAFIDNEFTNTEKMIIEDISNSLKIKLNDLENMINNFYNFYKQKENDKSINLQKAYEILGLSETDGEKEIKTKYRTLVKKHHPDIIAGQGGSKSIIEEATKKLQEINEAYELVKKHKGL